MDDTLIQMLRFAVKGYACSQIMVLLALDKSNTSNPGLVRAAAGLANGCGNGSGSCGILTGACCVLGYFAGKGTEEDQGNDKLFILLEEMTGWFEDNIGKRHGGISCQSIVGEAGPENSKSICGGILSETYAQTMKILSEHSIDVTGKDDSPA